MKGAASKRGSFLFYQRAGRDASNVPSFSMTQVSGAYHTQTYDTYINLSQVWSLQVGLRYIFN